MAYIGCAFFYFVFLKIYCGAVFYNWLSIIGALISSIIIICIEFIQTLFIRKTLSKSAYESTTGPPALKAGFSFWAAYICTLPLMTLAVVLVSIGFSVEFFEHVISGRGHRYDSLAINWGNVWLLGLGILAMILSSSIIAHMGLKSVARDEF